MSVNKYTPAVLAGIRNGAQQGGTLFRWPATLPGLDGTSVGPFARCVDCPPTIHAAVSGTFKRYGGRPLCLPCRKRRAA